MKKILIASVLAGIFLLASGGADPVVCKMRIEVKDSEIINKVKAVEVGYFTEMDSELVKYLTYNTQEREVKIVKPSIPEKPEYDIPLDNVILEYAWQLGLENDISYALIWAMAYQEGEFSITAYNDSNRNLSNDQGLMQINSSNVLKASKSLGYTIDRSNPFNSLDAAIWLITTIRDKYSYLDMNCETEIYFLVTAYNMGESNAIDWIENNGCQGFKYTDDVLQYKKMLERDGFISGRIK